MAIVGKILAMTGWPRPSLLGTRPVPVTSFLWFPIGILSKMEPF